MLNENSYGGHVPDRLVDAQCIMDKMLLEMEWDADIELCLPSPRLILSTVFFLNYPRESAKIIASV